MKPKGRPMKKTEKRHKRFVLVPPQHFGESEKTIATLKDGTFINSMPLQVAKESRYGDLLICEIVPRKGK